MRTIRDFRSLIPAILFMVPGGAFAQAWENAAGARLADAAGLARAARASFSAGAPTAAPGDVSAERDEAARSTLASMRNLDGLIAAALKNGEAIDSKKALSLAEQAGLFTAESEKTFERLRDILTRENIAEIQAEAAALGISVDAYRDPARTLIWSALMTKIADVKSRMNQLTPERLFAEYVKYDIRLKSQQGRFVADNRFREESAFYMLRSEIFDKLGLSNIKLALSNLGL
ncbi:MAG: hypothetical protein HY403_12745 [Elusimicrobia bacterium]|nr:hypothetical protein [Elusimicrobiota bacterium]